jgi:hypothetical protein
VREIAFVVAEDETDGGFTARAHWAFGNRDIFTGRGSRDELIRNIGASVDATFEDVNEKLELIHLRRAVR